MNLERGIYILHFKNKPKSIHIKWNGKTWIDRKLNGKFDCIKFKAPFSGFFTSSEPVKKIEKHPFHIEPSGIELYPYERNLKRPYVLSFNGELSEIDTPARIFAHQYPALIEIGKRFYHFSPQVRYFILLHELGHQFYKTEHKTDLFALKRFLDEGFNASEAFNALNILHKSPQAQDRIKKLFEQLKLNGYVG